MITIFIQQGVNFMEKNIGLALATFAMLDQRSINTVQKRKNVTLIDKIHEYEKSLISIYSN